MKRLLIDMDGVLADFESTLHSCFPHIKDMPDSKEKGDEVDRCCASRPGIFGELEMINGAYWAFELLSKHYEVYFLSTPMWLVPQSYMDKRIWVEQMFGDLATKKLILTHNKGIIEGNYLIDDRIKHGVDQFKGEHIHFGQKGFEGWLEVVKYLNSKDKFLVNLDLNLNFMNDREYRTDK